MVTSAGSRSGPSALFLGMLSVASFIFRALIRSTDFSFLLGVWLPMMSRNSGGGSFRTPWVAAITLAKKRPNWSAFFREWKKVRPSFAKALKQDAFQSVFPPPSEGAAYKNAFRRLFMLEDLRRSLQLPREIPVFVLRIS